MTKSIIQQELEGKSLVFGLNEIQYYAYMHGEVYSAIQKALEELKKERVCLFHYPVYTKNVCEKDSNNCEFVYRELDIEKCFGDVKYANKKE